MKRILSILFLTVLILPVSLKAQIEKVIVEKYYVSDANDATDTTGGVLEEGSVTYRIYIDMAPACKLKKIYGDGNHAIHFSSTANFFNNSADGQSFAKDFSKNRLEENTVALDSWLTLGQIIKTGAKTYFGILKSQDTDGSFIGGVNNDGGSAGVPTGLLVNSDPSAGPPLTYADGIDTMFTIPANWADYGILDDSTHIDSTIFGSVKISPNYSSNNFGLQNSGVMGVNPDSNQVLVAQLTTIGELSFELNIIVEEPGTPNPVDVKYVARLASGEMNSDTLKLCPFLSYPLACGCQDPDFLEYNAGYGCSISDSCKTRIVFGCMDSLACNYDPNANFNISSLCCYPGYCNNRDISVVCPSLANESARFSVYPNPASDIISIHVLNGNDSDTRYAIYNSFGKLLLERNIGKVSGDVTRQIDLAAFKAGMYMIRLFSGNTASENKIFIKN